tara:strand:- start:260 stop:1693 length:1434 start_codon:yes stop_codon:yes gene_type:complete
MSLTGNGEYYMSWQLINTVELAATFLLFSAIFATLIFYMDTMKSGFLRTALLFCLTIIPFSFFLIHLIRQFIGADRVESIIEKLVSTNILGLNLTVLLCVVMLLFVAFLRKTLFSRSYENLISIIIVLSPLSILTFLIIILHGFNGFSNSIGALNELSNHTNVLSEKKNSIYVFLFDELDYTMLYKDGKLDSDYPNLRHFSEQSENYHNARSPGNETLTSIPRLLLNDASKNIHVCGNVLCANDVGEKDRILNMDDNVFKLARSFDFKTATVGWAHPYCEQYADDLDYCRSHSIYNHSILNPTFSLLSPINTNIIMLPHQLPFGFLKNPVYSEFHHQNVSQTHQLALKIIEQGDNLFSFFHYPIPHIPFVYDGDQYVQNARPFLENRDNYKKQLRYVDKLFGELITGLKDAGKLDLSTIVVFSDHGFRKILPSNEDNHVPMMIYRGEKPYYSNVTERVPTEEKLFALLTEIGLSNSY